MKRFTAVSLVLILLCACALITPAYAEASRFTYINTVGATLSINESSGIASCVASCRTHNTSDSIRIVGSLQRYNSNSNSWSQIKSWTKTGSGNITLDKSYAVYSGYRYRFVATVSIFDSNGQVIESTTPTSYYNYF